jgi:hypothetical protein
VLEVLIRDGGAVRHLTGAVSPDKFVRKLRGEEDEVSPTRKGQQDRFGKQLEWGCVENVVMHEEVD